MTGIVGSSGTSQQYFVYDPYGADNIFSGSWGSVVDAYNWSDRFTGRQYDSESKIYLYRARYYHHLLGRFLARDPLGLSPGSNLFEYANGNPIIYADPWGLDVATQKCCDDFYANSADTGAAQQICCGGTPVGCANRKGISKNYFGVQGPGLDLIANCAEQHEQMHIDDTKPSCSCKADGTVVSKSYPPTPEGSKQHSDEECKGLSTEIKCWEKAKTDPCAAGDANCESAVALRWKKLHWWQQQQCKGIDPPGAVPDNFMPPSLPWKS